MIMESVPVFFQRVMLGLYCVAGENVGATGEFASWSIPVGALETFPWSGLTSATGTTAAAATTTGSTTASAATEG